MFSDEKKKELLFPHEQVRKSQENLVLDIEKAIEEKKRLVANAPTGLGKTSSVLGPALSYALKNNLTVWFLTNRHTQHRLAVDTLKLIQEKFKIEFSCVDLIGKRWMCGQEVKDLYVQEFQEFCKSLTEKGECFFLNRVKEKNKLTVEAKEIIERLQKKGISSSEEIISLCQERNLCSYEISLELAKKARLIIGDYYYLFNPFIQQVIFNRLDKELEKTILVIDEAHNLPNRIVEMLSSRLTNNMLKNAVLEAKKSGFSEIIPLLEQLNQSLLALTDFDKTFSSEKLVKKEDFLREIKSPEEIIDQLELVADEIRKNKRKSYISGIANFLTCWLQENEGFVRIIGEKETIYGPLACLSYDCLDPSLATKEIFEKVHSAVLMSGTLQPTFMYNDILNVKGTEKDYPNPFPPENKLALIVPETTTRYSLRSKEMYQRISQKCSEILRFIPGNCTVFFPSYELRDLIGLKIETQKKKFWEKAEMAKEEKEALLAEFKKEKDQGGILLGVMGGNFGEGIDLPGDFLQGVIVIGVPLSRPNLRTKELVKYFEKKYNHGWEYGYLYPAMNKCFQSAGRCIRAAEDRGVVVFLDERFAWQDYLCCFPKENLIITKDFEKYLKKFFGG